MTICWLLMPFTSNTVQDYTDVLKLIKQETDAEGIVQDVFVKIWESRENIDTYSSFDSYLFTIAYNNTMSLLRKRVSERKYLDHLSSVQQISNSNDIIEEIHFNEVKNNIQKVIEQLTPRQKEVFELSREEGLSYKEIAQKLKISQNTVEIHMSKALKYIKLNIDKSLIINLLFISLFLS